MKRKRAKEKEKLPSKKGKSALPAKVVEEIKILIEKLKNILSDNKRFEPDFGNKIIQKMFEVGKLDGSAYSNDVYAMIHEKYPNPTSARRPSQERAEIHTFEDIAYDLMHLIDGSHEKVRYQKKKILQKNIENEICKLFYGEISHEGNLVEDQVKLAGSIEDGSEL